MILKEPFTPTGIRLGIVRGISYGLFAPPDEFASAVRELGGGLVRLYIYWSQVEPEPGRYEWSVVDTMLEQMDDGLEAWVTVCSSSPWATRQPTDFLPPSPAKDNDAYERFVYALVQHCAGRVQYWQCNNEPSNTGLLWAGTAPEYAAQLAVLHRAVRAASPGAAVVLGGCGYDVLSSPEGSPARTFFDEVIALGRDSFDLFAVHLYDDPVRIPEHIESVGRMMRRYGYERPVIVGEYGGPTLFEFPEVEAVLQETMSAVFAESAAVDLSTAELAAQVGRETPDRLAVRKLYSGMADLPPQVQMFMEGCPPALEATRHRISCRELVTRNLLAMSVGVRRTACWNLAPEVPNYVDPFNVMGLMYGKLALMDYADGKICRRHPSAETFRLLARQLVGASGVARIDVSGQPDLYVMEIRRQQRGPLLVLWRQGDAFSGENMPATPVEWPWPVSTVQAIDAFGMPQSVDYVDGRVRIPVSITPIFLSANSNLVEP